MNLCQLQEASRTFSQRMDTFIREYTTKVYRTEKMNLADKEEKVARATKTMTTIQTAFSSYERLCLHLEDINEKQRERINQLERKMDQRNTQIMMTTSIEELAVEITASIDRAITESQTGENQSFQGEDPTTSKYSANVQRRKHVKALGDRAGAYDDDEEEENGKRPKKARHGYSNDDKNHSTPNHAESEDGVIVITEKPCPRSRKSANYQHAVEEEDCQSAEHLEDTGDEKEDHPMKNNGH